MVQGHCHSILTPFVPSWVLGFGFTSPKNSVYMSILWPRTSPQRTNKIIPMLRIGNQQYINNINRQFSKEESVRYST